MMGWNLVCEQSVNFKISLMHINLLDRCIRSKLRYDVVKFYEVTQCICSKLRYATKFYELIFSTARERMTYFLIISSSSKLPW